MKYGAKIGMAFVGAASTAVVGVNLATTQTRPAPARSLLQIYNLKEAAISGPHPTDITTIVVNSSTLDLDVFIGAFVASPIFTLEQHLIALAGIAKVVPVPRTFNVGQEFAIWRVVERNSREALLLFKMPSASFRGSSYFSIVNLGNGRTELQFGSGIDENSLNAPGAVAAVGTYLHYFYSRVLLLNTVGTLWLQGHLK